jgi:hypothetical protein
MNRKVDVGSWLCPLHRIDDPPLWELTKKESLTALLVREKKPAFGL